MPVDRHGGEGVGAWWLVLLLPLACCGLPLLLAVVGTGAFAAFWAKGYGYAAGAALAVVVGALTYLRVKRTGLRGRTCGTDLPRTEKAAASAPRRAAGGR